MSVRVDFYVLAQANESLGWQFACKLAEKAYQHKQRLFVYCQDQAAAHRFDELLWTFHDISFIPHLLQDEKTAYPPPIHIGYRAPTQKYPLLLNLTDHRPDFYTQSKRILEIVYGEAAQRDLARERFKTYRLDHCELMTHQIDA